MNGMVSGMLAVFLSASVAQSAARRMNVLLITTDDMGKTAGCYGDKLAITPNLDRLANEGMLFTSAYVTHASCSSSRSSILTGLYPHQNGQIGLAGARPEYRVKDGISTLPALMKAHGYYTGIIGKLHVLPVEMFPFDYNQSKANLGAEHQRDVRNIAVLAETFLQQAGTKPFFLYVNYFDPHRPYDERANQFKGLPEKPYGPDDVVPFSYLGLDGPVVREEVAAYYNCVNRMDVGLGMLLENLKKAGVYDDTLIIFLGDHGVPFTRAKTTAYEAGEAVPFIVEWPGVGEAGVRNNDFISSVDIMPTILDAVGADCPPVAGQSLRRVVEGKTPAAWRKVLFAEYTSHAAEHFYPRRSVRNKEFKLIHNLDFSRANPIPFIDATRIRPGVTVDPHMQAAYETTEHPPEWELYQLGKDPYETVNLVGNPEYAAELKKLQAMLRDWQKETDDPLLDPAELQRLKKLHGVDQ
ncbi:MAG: sulfatase [Kiritimatiellales bacterium]|nr:sulfatase [Kiritimatiellales bacterium]MCF7863657.1 sulfatase [Kiritimatiellales bacterium]